MRQTKPLFHPFHIVFINLFQNFLALPVMNWKRSGLIKTTFRLVRHVPLFMSQPCLCPSSASPLSIKTCAAANQGTPLSLETSVSHVISHLTSCFPANPRHMWHDIKILSCRSYINEPHSFAKRSRALYTVLYTWVCSALNLWYVKS